MENFHAALAQAKILYDIELSQVEGEEIGLIAWYKIGNKNCKLYKYTTSVDSNNSIELPCNCIELVAVTNSGEEWNKVTNITQDGDYSSFYTEDRTESLKQNKNPRYISGGYVKFEKVGDTLYFDKGYENINILYKGIILDEDDLPYLTNKEVSAIASYCAYTKKYKDALRLNNPSIFQIAQALEQKWFKLCDAARVPEYVTQNEWNEVLDVMTSWDRKKYGKSFKLIK